MTNLVHNITLYHRPTCPFCIRVKNALKELNLTLAEENITTNYEAQRELIEQGGRRQVPALKIRENNGAERWLYESGDIIRYLNKIAKQYKDAA